MKPLLSMRNVTKNRGDDGPVSQTVCLLMKSEGNDFWNSVAEGTEVQETIVVPGEWISPESIKESGN